ncbi:MAG: tetratricopeptide repeat protein, partial [Syntrophales bacterium]|nr:tetratricopeptide repeat protein [Syntrophales bacterium]
RSSAASDVYKRQLYLNNGKIDAAIAAFKRALSNLLYDTPAVALYNLGRAYAMQQDYEKALSKYQEAADKDTKREILPLIMLEMGRVSVMRGETDKAIIFLKRAVELVPNFVEAHYLLADCYLKQGLKAQGRESLETVIKLAPQTEFGRLAKERLGERTIR